MDEVMSIPRSVSDSILRTPTQHLLLITHKDLWQR